MGLTGELQTSLVGAPAWETEARLSALCLQGSWSPGSAGLSDADACSAAAIVPPLTG